MINVINVRLHGRGKAYHFDPAGLALHQGDLVIVETSQGVELGLCSGEVMGLEPGQIKGELKPVLRLATDADIDHFEANQEKEAEAYCLCLEKIAEHELEMNLVDVEYMFDNKRLIFYFTAEGRVDFRNLVKDLANTFHTRIELRQIGVRDEARLLGGIGICGRELCCVSFLRQFSPVSIKMAKEQSLSMNPAKISGNCGRLLCCLNYEQEAYQDARKRMPKPGTKVNSPYGRATVNSVDLLRETVRLKVTSGESFEVYEVTLDQLRDSSD